MKSLQEKLLHLFKNIQGTPYNKQISVNTQNELNRLLATANAMMALCRIINSNEQLLIRNMAAKHLLTILENKYRWEVIKSTQMHELKESMLSALKNAFEPEARVTIAHCVGIIMQHIMRKDDAWILAVLKFLQMRCHSNFAYEQQLGAQTYAILTERAIKNMSAYTSMLLDMFEILVQNIKINNNDVNNGKQVEKTPESVNKATLCNMIKGLVCLTSLKLHRSEIIRYANDFSPLIVKSLRYLVYGHNSAKYLSALGILDRIAANIMHVMDYNLELYITFYIEIASNDSLDIELRSIMLKQVPIFFNELRNDQAINKQCGPLLTTVFNIIAEEPYKSEQEDVEDYKYSKLELEGSQLYKHAVQTLLSVIRNMSVNKLVMRFTRVLRPEITNSSEQRRRAFYLCLNYVAEYAINCISKKNIERLLTIVDTGIEDDTACVRNIALQSIGYFTEHFQPGIWSYSERAFAMLIKYFSYLNEHLKDDMGAPRGVYRLFYALEQHCQHTSADNIEPYVHTLISHMNYLLNNRNKQSICAMALNSIAAIVNAANATSLKNHLRPLLATMQTYMHANVVTSDQLQMRCYAMDVVCGLANAFDAKTFQPFADSLFNYSIKILEHGPKNPLVRRSAYHIIGAISSGNMKQMPNVVNDVIKPIYESISHRCLNYSELSRITAGESNFDSNYNIDIISEQQAAIDTLKQFALKATDAFFPHMENAFKIICAQVDHPDDEIRKITLETLTQFIIVAIKRQDLKIARSQYLMFWPKLTRIICEIESVEVLLTALKSLSLLICNLGKMAVEQINTADTIFLCIKDVLNNKVSCCYGIESAAEEKTEEIIKCTAKLLPEFGKALTPEQFALYFAKMPRIMQRTCRNNLSVCSANSMRVLYYETIASCLEPLAGNYATYKEALSKQFIQGLNDTNKQVHKAAMLGLGDIIYHTHGNNAQNVNNILNMITDSMAQESDSSILDIYCGVLARFIIRNHRHMQLSRMILKIFNLLPLTVHIDQHRYVVECFELLYHLEKKPMEKHILKLLGYLKKLLSIADFKPVKTLEVAKQLLLNIYKDYRDKFQLYANANPIIRTYLLK